MASMMAKLFSTKSLSIPLRRYEQSKWRRLATLNDSVSAVLDFWFKPGESMQTKYDLWFSGNPDVDDTISNRFGDLVNQARSGKLKHWEEHPKSALAQIILLDQFCRNIFRGKPESFSHDHVALKIARELVSRGIEGHKSFTSEERSFVYLPFEHSEDIQDQVKSIELFSDLLIDTEGTEFHKYAKGNLEFAKQHKAVIEKFGRFPKRNAVLGRINTPEEEQFLESNSYSF